MNLNDTSKELFAKIRGRFPTVTIGNQAAEVTNDPHAARFFDFDFKAGNKVLGKVSISISEQDGLVVIHSADLSQTEDLVARENWFSFLKELRQFAKSRMMTFDTRDITKSNLEKRDYNFLSNMSQPKEVTEAALTGTNKTSFQNIGNSKLIIKHSAPVDEDFAAGRTHKIHVIYVENMDGERFKYPFKHINGARAMARHVSEGGKPYDDFGKHIVGLSEELAKLRKFKNYVNRSAVMAETLKEYSQVINDRIEEIKDTIQGLQKESFYRLTKENFKANETLTVPEDVKENWIDELTIKTFNDELQEVFPYIYKLVTQKPIKEITAEDFETEAGGYQGSTETRNLKYNVSGDFDRDRPVSDEDAFTIQDLLKKNGIESEVTPDEGNYQGIVIYTNAAPQSVEKVLGNMIETTQDPIEQFEKILDSIIDEGENTLFSSDSEEQKQALEKLNLLMKNHFPAGVNGVNGLESLEGIIDDPNLNDQIREIGKKDSDTCIRPLIMAYIQNKKPEMAKRINTGDMKMSTEGNQFAQAVRKAKAAGMKPGDKFKVGDKEYTLKDAMDIAGIGQGIESVQEQDNKPIMINGKQVNVQSIELELGRLSGGRDAEKDAAAESYVEKAFFMDGTELSDAELEILNDQHHDLIYDMAYDRIVDKSYDFESAVQEASQAQDYAEKSDEKTDVQQILNKHLDAYKKFKAGDDLYNHKELYSELLDYYVNSGDMPYGTSNAKDGDPINWITTRLADMGLIEAAVLPQNQKQSDLQAKLKALQDIAIDPNTSKDPELKAELIKRKAELEKQKTMQPGKESYHADEDPEELAKEIWNNNPEYHSEYKDWQEFAKSEDFQFEVDRLRSKFENKKEDLHKGTTKIEELVKSFYDYTTNKFPKGETAVITAVQKQYGDAAAKTAIETIKTLQSGKDMEIERIKQLAGYSTKK